jgi:hypothetical protein
MDAGDAGGLLPQREESRTELAAQEALLGTPQTGDPARSGESEKGAVQPVFHARASGFHFIWGERVAVLPLEEVGAMLGIAKMIEDQSQGQGFDPASVQELTAFGARLRDELKSAGKSAGYLDLDTREASIVKLLAAQTSARRALESRVRYVCKTCGRERIRSPETQQLLRRNQILMTVARSVGVAISSHGTATVFMVSSLIGLVKLDPDFQCLYCEGTKAEESIIVFCPTCKAQHNEALLGTCPKCGHEFLAGLPVASMWQPRETAQLPGTSGRQQFVLSLAAEPTALTFDSRGQQLAIALKDGTVQVWEADQGWASGEQPKMSWSKAITGVSKPSLMAIDPQGDLLAVASRVGLVGASHMELVRLADGADVGVLGIYGHSQLSQMVFSPGGEQLALATQHVELWQVDQRKRMRTIKRPMAAEPTAVAFDPAGERLAVNGLLSALVFDVAKGKRLRKLAMMASAGIAWTPDGRVLVGGGAKSVTARSVVDGELVARFEFDVDVKRFALSPDGSRFVVACSDATARLFDLSSGDEVARIKCAAQITALTFAPQGYVALALSDASVQVWASEEWV